MLVVVDTSRGNLRSVEKALVAAGGDPVRSSDPEVVRRADQVVVPGQGAFADAMNALTASGLDQALAEFIASGKPYLGICLGLQLLFESSEEHHGGNDNESRGINRENVAGLGLLPGRVVRLRSSSSIKIPHMGWNNVRAETTDAVLAPQGPSRTGVHYYFVHSYVAVPENLKDVVLCADHGQPMCAAIRHDNMVATQFHPEKSQAAGIALLKRFLND